jgi:hypothetical protein
MQRRMQVLSGHARAGQRGQLGDRAALRVLPRQLEGDRALACDRVLPDLPGFDRPLVAWSEGIRMRHVPILTSAAWARYRGVRSGSTRRVQPARVTREVIDAWPFLRDR